MVTKSRFDEWLKKKGESTLKFSERSKMRYATVARAVHGHKVQEAIAKRISRYTGYEITLEDLGHRN